MNERRVSLGPDRLSLAVCSWNEAQPGTALVILHGFLEQGAAWDAVATRLGRPVYAPDQRGHGRSDHVGTGGFYHFWDYVSDLDALLEQLSPNQPVDLLGHSMGGTVASLYAGARPERVRRLVLVEGLGPPDTEDQGVQRARQFLANQRRPRDHGQPFDTAEQAVARMTRHNPSLSPVTAARLAERLLEPQGDKLRWAWDARHRARSPTPFVERQFLRFLQQISAPTLVIYGEDSPFPGIERADALQNVTVQRQPDAAHLIHHDQPAQLAARIEAHLGAPDGC